MKSEYIFGVAMDYNHSAFFDNRKYHENTIPSQWHRLKNLLYVASPKNAMLFFSPNQW